MNPIKKANLEKGEKAENKYFDLFRRIFDGNLIKSKNKYDIWIEKNNKKVMQKALWV